MIKYKDVIKELESLINGFAEANTKGDEEAKILLKIRHAKLKPIILILGTNPKEAFLRTQLDEQIHKLEVIEKRYTEWAKEEARKYDNPKTVYRTTMGINDIKKRIKVLKEILQ